MCQIHHINLCGEQISSQMAYIVTVTKMNTWLLLWNGKSSVRSRQQNFLASLKKTDMVWVQYAC